MNIWVNFGAHGAHLPTSEVRTVLGNSVYDCALCALVPVKRVNGVQGVAVPPLAFIWVVIETDLQPVPREALPS